MKNQKTHTQLQQENELLKHFEKRSREQGGGSYYKLLKDGVAVGVEWGRSFSDVMTFLTTTQLNNRKFGLGGRPWPGNVQFTRVIKLT